MPPPKIISARPKDIPSRRVPVTCGRLCAAAIWENPMTRLRHAPRLHHAVVAGLAMMLVMSCSETGGNKSPATASGQAQPAAPQAVAEQDIVTTARRADGGEAKSEDRLADSRFA